MGSRRRLRERTPRELEQARRAMEGNAPVILDLQPLKVMRQILLAPFLLLLYRKPYTGTGTGAACRGGRACFSQVSLGRRLRADLGQGIFQLCDSGFQLFRVG